MKIESKILTLGCKIANYKYDSNLVYLFTKKGSFKIDKDEILQHEKTDLINGLELGDTLFKVVNDVLPLSSKEDLIFDDEIKYRKMSGDYADFCLKILFYRKSIKYYYKIPENKDEEPTTFIIHYYKNKKMKYRTYSTLDKREIGNISRLLYRDIMTLNLTEDKFNPYYYFLGMEACDLILGKEKLYKKFKKQTSTKMRTIYAPNKRLKKAQKLCLKVVKTKPNGIQFAYKKGTSTFNNIEVHRDNNYIMKCDIASFYDNCKTDKIPKFIVDVLIDNIYHYLNLLTLKETGILSKKVVGTPTRANLSKIADGVAHAILINPDTGGLYQGSPLSGEISNMILAPFGYLLTNYLKKKGYDYTVSIYADDITISSKEPFTNKKKRYLAWLINEFLNEKIGTLKLKPAKTKRGSNNKRYITGLVINHKNQITVPGRMYNMLRAVFHRLSKGEEITFTRKEVQGQVNYCLHNDETGKIIRLLKKYPEVTKEIMGEIEL